LPQNAIGATLPYLAGGYGVPTRNVVLTERQAKLIESLVGSGRYQNASEVLRESLRLIERREMEDAAKLQALREAAGFGISALERGAFREFTDGVEIASYLTELSDRVISGT
jgi:antitoxin ParD1/3/4